MSDVFNKYSAPLDIKLNNFEKYVRRQAISRFLARYELFKLQLGIKGSVIECGVHHGGGLMAWAKLSSALEPYGMDRLIYGFDTYEGFPGVTASDQGTQENDQLLEGGFDTGYDVYNELMEVIAEYDANRFINSFQKVFLVKGDALATIPRFIEENPHILVSLLFLDFDLYEPTRIALENFVPRMGKGSIIAFDEINNPWWPGETRALLEYFDLHKYQLQRFTFDPNIAYIVV